MTNPQENIESFNENIIPLFPVQDTVISQADQVEQSPDQPGWLRRNLFKLSVGAFIGGSAVSLALNPLGHIEKEVEQAAPWTGGGIVVTESMWIGGAAMMLAGAGKKMGNPITLFTKRKQRWPEIKNAISSSIDESKLVKAGFAINAIGALGTAGVGIAGAATGLPPETWPSIIAPLGADMASTIAIRSAIVAGRKNSVLEAETYSAAKLKVRHARIEDMEALADLDILLFDKAYGTEKPEKQEVIENFTARFNNASGWMFVGELDGEIAGFVTAFRTDKPIEDFVSWEESTNNGTLNERVVPDGKYVYVANMTIKHEAMVKGADSALLANLFANAIRDGVEYGYFIARMPHFKRWLEGQDIDLETADIQSYAEQYLELRSEDGKRQDPQLRMYEADGFKLKRMVANGFEDDASMNYGVIFQADIPYNKLTDRKRATVARALRLLAKKPKLLEKVL